MYPPLFGDGHVSKVSGKRKTRASGHAAAPLSRIEGSRVKEPITTQRGLYEIFATFRPGSRWIVSLSPMLPPLPPFAGGWCSSG
jgi:hypothetical protein